MTSANLWDFLIPSSPCCCLLFYTINSRNYPYCVCFPMTPSLLKCGRHLWMIPRVTKVRRRRDIHFPLLEFLGLVQTSKKRTKGKSHSCSFRFRTNGAKEGAAFLGNVVGHTRKKVVHLHAGVCVIQIQNKPIGEVVFNCPRK